MGYELRVAMRDEIGFSNLLMTDDRLLTDGTDAKIPSHHI
jgi:hypothetical protein